MVRRVASSIFVGRVAERAELIAGLDAAGRGEPGLVVLGGEAGIGKSRLAAELWATAEAGGARVVRGRCLETKAVTLPFAPWIEILRDLLLADRERVVVSSQPGSSELARLVPELRSSFGPDAPSPGGDDPGQLFHAVLALLRTIAGARPPLLIVVEDLHWADTSSLDLLRFVAAGLTVEPLLVVATFRIDELPKSHGLQAMLGELVRLPHVLRLDLRPFDQREVAEQLTGISGRPPAPDVLNQVFARSDGNPFVVEELAGQPPGSPLPPTLRDVMATRMSTLSPETRRVVAAAATIGRDVGREILATIAGMPEKQVLQALREATDKHVLVHAASFGTADFTFRHALIQEFAYGELSPAERRELHGGIAQALMNGGGSSGEIARHARLAGDLRVAIASTVAAAHEATDALAFAEALACVLQALEMWGEVADPEASTHTDRPALLALGARCAVAIGDWVQAVALRRSALNLLDPARRAERIALLLDLADSLQFSADWPGVADTIREAAALIPPSPPTAQRARVVAELANSAMDDGRVDEARRLAEEAIEIARASDAATEEVRARIALALTFVLQLRYRAASDILAAAAEILVDRSVTDEYVVATLLARRAEIANLVGDFQGAIAMTEAALERATRAGTIAQQRPFLRWRTIDACLALGRWAEAEELVVEAEHDTTPWQYQWTVDFFLDALIRQGRLAEAEDAVRKTDDGYDTPWQGTWILQARIRLANALGRWADARAAAEEAIGLFPVEGRGFLYELLPDMIRGEADAAEAARARRRKTAEAEARLTGLDRLDLLRDIVRGAIEQGGAGPLVEATLAMAEAEGSRLRAASEPERWEDAARRSRALARPWETAYAQFRQAEAILATRGERQAALPLLRDARLLASELAARPLLEQIDGLAGRARLRLHADGRRRIKRQAINDEGVVVTITTREREVLNLVAAGHTNREIGEALFISEKTASVHVTNAMDKLGALSRYDAAASANRLGLLDRGTDGTDLGRK